MKHNLKSVGSADLNEQIPVVPRIGSRRRSGEIIVIGRFDGADISKLLLSYCAEISHTHGIAGNCRLQEEPKLSTCSLAHFTCIEQELSRRKNVLCQELRREDNRLRN